MRALQRRVISGAGAAVLVAAGLAGAASPAAAADRVVLAAGHTDAVDIRYTDGKLALRVNDDTVSPAVTRDPAGVTFQVLPAARTEVPDLAAFDFLGAPGTPIWMLPQVQDPALLWPGWNTTGLGAGVFAGDEVTLSLIGAEGPGAVTVFDTSSLGAPNIRFRSADGLPDRIGVPVHTHAHASWVFGAQGRYTLTFQADATLTSGAKVSTGAVDYDVVVGELPGQGENPGGEGPGGDPGGEGPGGEPGGASKSITASIDPTAGALVISVDPADRAVALPAARLSAGGDRWESSGALKPVTVTDTRAAQPGWSASGQLSGGFANQDGAGFSGAALGWTPAVTSQGERQGVVAGPVATPGESGLGSGALLATAAAGAGRGTAKLDAQLRLSVPTDTAPGVYTGTLTLTAI